MNKRNSAFILTAAALLALAAAGPGLSAAKPKPKPATTPDRVAVGDFTVTFMSGWKKTIVERQPKTYHDVWEGKRHDYTIGYGKSITFTKKVGDATVSFGLALDRHDKPIPLDVLEAGIKRYEDEVVKARTPDHIPGSVLKSERTTFRGQPAYLSQTRGPADDPRFVTDSRTVTFATGPNVYTVSETLTGMELAKAEPVAATGWDAFMLCVADTGAPPPPHSGHPAKRPAHKPAGNR
jgi:hypothetical protein